MKTMKLAFGLLLSAVLLTGCSSAYYASGSGGYTDDMYATHDKAAIALRQKEQADLRKAEAEARRAEWEARLAEAKAAAAEDSYYTSRSNIVADTYESAYARRLYGFNSSSYNMPSSYYNLRYSPVYNTVTSYDPAFYNVMVMGDQVWVEPKYITSMFGTWGRPSVAVSTYAAGFYNRWYYEWGYTPYYSWTWGYPHYSWGFHNPYFGWNFGWNVGWGWNYHPWNHYPGWGYPGWGPGGKPHRPGGAHPGGGSWSRPGSRPGHYAGGYNPGGTPGSSQRPAYNVGGNRPNRVNTTVGNSGSGNRNNTSGGRNGSYSSGNRPSYGTGNRNSNGGNSSFNNRNNSRNDSSSQNSNRSSYNSSNSSQGSYSSSSGGGYSGGSSRSSGGNSRGR